MGSNSINLDLLRMSLIAEQKMSRKAYKLHLELTRDLETAHSIGA